MGLDTGIPPHRIEQTWRRVDLLAAVALIELENEENRLGLSRDQIRDIEKSQRRRKRLHERLLRELARTNAQIIADEEAAAQLAIARDRPQRRTAPPQPPRPPGTQPPAAAQPPQAPPPGPGITPGARSAVHRTSTGVRTLPPINYTPGKK
jgi:nucleoid-associated protein YgaU